MTEVILQTCSAPLSKNSARLTQINYSNEINFPVQLPANEKDEYPRRIQIR
jgi:hypothetical protein